MPKQPYDNRQQQAKQYYSSNRKVKADVFSFNPDITGQPANPMQLITKKVHDYAYDNNNCSNQNNIFTHTLTHICKLVNTDDMVICTNECSGTNIHE